MRADAIIVLGCASSTRLARRLDRGIGLYEAKAAPRLLLSGGGRGSLAEADTMRRMALDRGVPAAALLTESSSTDTLGNARECARLLRRHGLSRVILVSDRAHLMRAKLLFRLAGIEVVACAGVRTPSLSSEFGEALRELAALPRSLFRAVPRTRLPER
jgi:uncharacterized SAM-binding protein YcdF (DUF218 family)